MVERSGIQRFDYFQILSQKCTPNEKFRDSIPTGTSQSPP